MRVLDCKDAACIAVTSEGPMLIDSLCDDCRAHFDQVRRRARVDRHRDANSTRVSCAASTTTPAPTFEFVADALGGAQNAIGGGGRYDKLAEQLGGKPTSGIGFGSGIERLL